MSRLFSQVRPVLFTATLCKGIISYWLLPDDNVSQVRKVGQSLRESVEFSFSFWCDLHADRGRARCPTRDTRVLKAHH